MKVLHVVAPASIGGLEEVVIRLASGLNRRGHASGVAPILGDDAGLHPFVEALEAEGVPVHPIRIGARRYGREVTAVASLLEELGTDVLHTHGYRPDVLHRGSAARMGIATVTTLHGFTGGGWKNRMYERLQLRSARSFDAVVAVSQPMAGLLRRRGIAEDRLHVIPNAWSARHALHTGDEARRALNVPPDRFHVGWVGRLSREKGVDVFIEALTHLSQPPVIASVIGDGPLREEAERRAAKGPGHHDIRILGAVAGAGRLFPGFDLFVLSSRTEGTPIVLFEAMAAGVPVVATSVGGVPDVVNAQTALLVPSEDPRALAGAIEAVRSDPRTASARAERAREVLAERYAVTPWLARYEALYSSLCHHRNPSS